MMKLLALIVVLAIAFSNISAFVSNGSARSSRLNMAFSFGGKPKAATPPPVTGYIPAGLTATQYAEVLKKEAELKAKKQAKFPKGKEPESLTEFLVKNEKKGLKGKDLLLKGHRMVKAKYESFYTTESPV